MYNCIKSFTSSTAIFIKLKKVFALVDIPPLYDKKYNCMLCKEPFTTKKIRSRFIKVKKYDTDFCPTYASEENNPMLYYINVCPHCGFSFSDDFNPYFAPGTVETIIRKVCEKWVPSTIYSKERDILTAIKTLKLSSYCATLKKEKHIVIAGIYMRIAWLYRNMENEEQEKRFMKLGLNEYIESYTADDFQSKQISDVRVLYMIGELSRRIGDIDQAIKYFSKVIEKQNSTIDVQVIDWARERWHEIRELKKENREEVGDV